MAHALVVTERRQRPLKEDQGSVSSYGEKKGGSAPFFRGFGGDHRFERYVTGIGQPPLFSEKKKKVG